MAGCEDQTTECPLCMEPLEMDDINFFPCTCGYQICRFCWHRIRTDENGLCPACRKQYPEDPADFKPLTQEELQRIKNEKRQKDLQKKIKLSENRKHLANVRVVQKNLVFVVGLSQRLADPEVLKRHEYFGKFGKTHKVVINHSTTYAGSQGPSASAYVTYYRVEDALRAIQAVNNIHVDGRTLKASLGTTKYCSHFLKGQQCPKVDCMYLHELGDDAASFTKEEMQQGKHQEYEKKLHEQLFNSMRKQTTSPTNINSSTINNSTTNNSVQETESSTKETWPSLRSGSGSSNSSNSSFRNSKSPGKLENGHNQVKIGTRTRNASGDDGNINRSKGIDEFSNQANNDLSNSFNSFVTRSLLTDDIRPDSPNTKFGSNSKTGGQTGGIMQGPISSFCTNTILQTTTNGTDSPSHSLANLDSSSSASSSLSTSSADIAPYLESRNGFTDTPNSIPLATTSLQEWGNNSVTENCLDSAPSEPPRQENTDWQAAFGFGNSQSRDDDLGFDPWDESTKGLADLIEKESSSGHSASSSFNHNGVNHNYHFGDLTNTQNHHSRQQMPNIVNMSNPLTNQMLTRRLGAPPGFYPNTMANAFKIQRPYFDEYSMHQSPINHLPFPGNPPILTKPHVKDLQENHEHQDHFRSMFPNVNVSFGSGNVPLSQQQSSLKSWHCGNSDVSWAAQDPAVVSAGAVSDGRPESPPHWMSSLHQLTEMDYPVGYNNHQLPVNQFQNRRK
ncbi:CCR4-NOT transcription complex subunit 4 [Chamberlinius hualienensis]